jgi:hypothetical protein
MAMVAIHAIPRQMRPRMVRREFIFTLTLILQLSYSDSSRAKNCPVSACDTDGAESGKTTLIHDQTEPSPEYWHP